MEALGIDVRFLIAQLINFGLFTVIFVKLLYKPFKAYVSEQHKEEQEKDRLLKELQEKEDRLIEKEKKVLSEARVAAAGILKEAERNADKKRKEIITKAQQDATTIKKKAQDDIEDNRKKMHDEIRSKVVNTSKIMTESILKEFLNKNNQRSILEEAFSKLKSSKIYEN